jgi:hypothetical protein
MRSLSPAGGAPLLTLNSSPYDVAKRIIWETHRMSETDVVQQRRDVVELVGEGVLSCLWGAMYGAARASAAKTARHPRR